MVNKMKKKFLLLSFLLASTATVQAGPAYMVGISYTFSGDVGLSFKVLSSDIRHIAVATVGTTYYPFSPQKLGLDLGVGYTYNNAAITTSWDFLKSSVQFSAGYADIDKPKKKSDGAPPLPPVVPGP